MILVFSLLLIMSLFSLKLTNRLNMPILLVFLLFGILTGSDFLNLIHFDDMIMTQQIANIALIFIIFDSGFNLKRETVKSVFAPSLLLATLGVIATAVLVGLFIHFVMKFDLLTSFLIGSIISSTDASAVINIMKNHPVRPKISNTLIFESAANDSTAILMTIFFIQLITAQQTGHPGIMVATLIWQVAGGILTGIGIGFIGSYLFKLLKPENRGFFHILIIGICLMGYGVATVAMANGIIAVFFCGIIMGNSKFPYKKGVSGFMEGVSSFANISLFLLLGLLVFPRQLPAVMGNGIIIAVVTFLVVRVLVTFLITPFFKYKFRESLFIAFAGIKGAVPIVLATYPSANGLDDQHMIFNIVIVVVILSLLFQGTLIKPVSHLLKLNVPKTRKSDYSFELLSTNDTSVDIYEHRVESDSVCCERCIKDLDLPDTVSITSVIREGKIIIPRGNTQIHADDVIYILATEEEFNDLKI